MAGDCFGQASFLDTARAYQPCTVDEIQPTILAEVYIVVGDAPQADDIAVLALGRDR